MLWSGNLPIFNLLTGQKLTFSPRGVDSFDRFTWNLALPRSTRVRLATRNFTPMGSRDPQNINHFQFSVRSCLAGANPWTVSKIFAGLYRTLHWCFKFDVIRFTGYGVIAEEPCVCQLGQFFFEHPVGITMRWIKENGWHLLWWPRRALSPCKVWGRSYNTCRLYVRCLYVYQQDVAKRQTAGIKFSHKPKISFLATQGRLVALIHVKLGRAPGSAWLCKILSQSARGGWECGPKY